MDLRLDGKTALVTGGSRGIGLAIARAMAESGASVMISSRKPDALEEAAAGIKGEVAWFAANAGDPEAGDACAAATVERFGSLDVLVNNAATNPYAGPIIDIPVPAADKTVQVNQRGVLSWTQSAWRAWMREHGGNVINVSSVGAMSADGVIGYYNVTKAAVLHLTRQLAFELGPNVRVNAIAPGLVKTDFARMLWEGDAGAFVAKRLPLKRLGEPDDIAGAAVFLASDASAWMTGATLVVDGGALTA
jgi:NAD(P)-dependent dehydrogenase (short-subunit alcohol dehydrogenase family)